MRVISLALMLGLAACHSQATRDEINRMEANGEIEGGPAPTPAAAARPAAAVAIDRQDALVDFHASWPAGAASIPALDKRFRADAEKAFADLIKIAREDKAMRDKDGLEYHQLSSTTDYRLAGASERLLSLEGVVEGYTGGAHGSHGSMAVLFDKVLGQDIGYTGLFVEPGRAFGSIAKAWCAGLDAERAKRRPADFEAAPDDPFSACPELDEIHVSPVDENRDGRFEALRIVADPYVAGPWAEGEYEVTLPVTAAMVAMFKPAYRSSFAA